MATRTATAAKIHDMWQESLSCDISSSVILRGEQSYVVNLGEDGRGRYVTCQLGRVLVYLYDLEAIRSHCESWVKAEAFGRRAFPDDYLAQGPRDADDSDRPLTVTSVVVQCEREQRPAEVDAATTAAAGLPYVQVRVGRLVVVCLDNAAVLSAASAWSQVRAQAQRWLLDPEEAGEAKAEIKSFERGYRWKGPVTNEGNSPRGYDLTRTAERLQDLERRLEKLEKRLKRSTTE